MPDNRLMTTDFVHAAIEQAITVVTLGIPVHFKEYKTVMKKSKTARDTSKRKETEHCR